MTIIGIDPGYKSGGVAIFRPDFQEVHDLPTFDGGGVNIHLLADLIREEGVATVFVERVHAMPKQGVKSSFNFGSGVGQIHATIAMMQLPMKLVTPGKWKKHYGLTSDKDMARQKAIQLFPMVASSLTRKKDADRAEALLIAAYGAAL